jgi:hypothetical protein
MKRLWLALAACATVTLAGGAASAAVAADAGPAGPAGAAAAQLREGDGPPGFWWGTDSLPVAVPGSAPYAMPFLGGAYGGYIGMTGNWAWWLGCSGPEHFLAYSATNAAQARTDYTKYGRGVGYGAYWFMGGPGVDPHYNGTTAEAYKWGEAQAARTLSDIAGGGGINYPVVWADIELPGLKPAPDNGWNSVYTSPCSGVVKSSSVPAAVDRADFNGYAAYITAHSSYKVGVYSSPGVWASIFGTGTASLIPNTYEWTYQPETTNYKGAYPHGWCLDHGTGACAEFFGGQTYNSRYALMWQWSGGGGVINGIGGFNGDLDQIDGARLG